MIIRQFGIMVLFLLVLLSCRRDTDNLDEAEAGKIKEEVRSMLNNYQRDVSQDGIMAELRYLDSSDAFSWHPPGFTGPIDYDSVTSILRSNDPLYSKIQSTWDSLVITPVTTTEALYVAVLTTRMSYTNGKADTFRLAETGKVVKRQSGWKLLSGKTVVK